MREKVVFLLIGMLFCGLLAHRIWRSAGFDPPAAHAMPAPAATAAEVRELYFTPAGAYTQADIAANGELPPADRYRGFQARHDFNPQPGDRLCPITRTKANLQCIWIIGGREYAFCCPPCIDEFVRLARRQPNAIQNPEAYVANQPPGASPRFFNQPPGASPRFFNQPPDASPRSRNEETKSQESRTGR